MNKKKKVLLGVLAFVGTLLFSFVMFIANIVRSIPH